MNNSGDTFSIFYVSPVQHLHENLKRQQRFQLAGKFQVVIIDYCSVCRGDAKGSCGRIVLRNRCKWESGLRWLAALDATGKWLLQQNCQILNTTQLSYLCDLVSIQPPPGHNTRSSPYVTLIKPSSSPKVTHRSFWHASPHFWNQLPTSLRIPHPNYSFPSQRPSFKHASWTCYTMLSPPSLFHCFTLSSKPTFSENLILHLSLFLSVGLISWL